jgi:hypothetical protein
VAGASFCTQCGFRLKAKRSGDLMWYAGAIIGVGILVILLFPTMRTPDETPLTPTQGPPLGSPSAGSPPQLSADMRENADRLFNRVMRSREAGDSADVTRFAPMAIMAYQNAGPLDADGLYHLSVLQLTAGDAAAARATADQILQTSPSHLLALSAAASAARLQNDTAAARGFYQRFIAALPTERQKSLPEYLDHAHLLTGIETEAREFLKR